MSFWRRLLGCSHQHDTSISDESAKLRRTLTETKGISEQATAGAQRTAGRTDQIAELALEILRGSKAMKKRTGGGRE